MMATFTVTFNTNNDAFAEDPAPEIARILRELADKVAEGDDLGLIRLRDVNGARVGFATSLDVAGVSP